MVKGVKVNEVYATEEVEIVGRIFVEVTTKELVSVQFSLVLGVKDMTVPSLVEVVEARLEVIKTVVRVDEVKVSVQFSLELVEETVPSLVDVVEGA